ncbi:MAG: tetratricopeptide repeat protein [bacterium]
MRIKIWWPLLFVAAIVLSCILIFPSKLKLADLLGRVGKYEEAIQNYQKALQAQPDREDIRMELGQIYLLNDEPELALQQFELASEIRPHDPLLLNKLFHLYSAVGKKEKILATLKKLAVVSPKAEYRVKLAEAYEWNSDTYHAVRLYEELLAKDPRNTAYLDKVIHLNLSLNKYRKTIDYLKRLLTIQPDNPEAQTLLGDLYLVENEKELAAAAFEQVLASHPDEENVRVKLAELYLWMQQVDGAILHYEYLLAGHRLNAGYFTKLIELTKDYAPEKALNYFQLRLRYLPGDNQLREQYADYFLHLGRTEKAVEQFKLLMKKNPDQSAYAMKLADLYHLLRQPQRAAKIYEKLFFGGYAEPEITHALIEYYTSEQNYDKLLAVFEELIRTQTVQTEIYDQYAETALLTQNYDKAKNLYWLLLIEHPQNLQYRMQLARLHLFKQETSQALDIIKQGLSNYPHQDESFLLFAGRLFAEYRYFEDSIYCFQRLVQLHPRNLEYLKLLAAQYRQNHNFARAAKIYEALLRRAPQDVYLQLDVAALYWLQNDVDKMRQITENLIRTRTGETQIRRKVGQFYFDRAYFDEAIELFETELKNSPADSATLRMLGLAYAWNNQPAAARKVLHEYQKLYPNDYYSHFQMGRLQHLGGRPKQAVEEFQTALALVEQAPQNLETVTVQAQIYAFLNERERALEQFESLTARHPRNLAIKIDYAESLLQLKEYERAQTVLDDILEQEPGNYRAWRLQSRSYFEQGQYRPAAEILAELERAHPGDVGLKIDRADAELASGDWYASKQTLENILKKYPATIPAHERLLALRRVHDESFATEYQNEKQADNFVKKIYNLLYSKAVSSLMHLKLLFGRETYSARDGSFAAQANSNFRAELNSGFRSRIQTSAAVQLQKTLSKWHLSGEMQVRKFFNSSNSVSVSTLLNETWNDPVIAAFYQGRMYNLQAEVNLTLLNRILLWNRLAYERYRIQNQDDFGGAFRAYLQAGYQWQRRPQLLTYYLFYHNNFHYQNRAMSNLIAIPGQQSIHYLGSALNHQLTKNLFYEMNASLGFDTYQNHLLFFGQLDIEYLLFNRLRLRSLFSYGNQNRLNGSEEIKTVSVYLNYYY